MNLQDIIQSRRSVYPKQFNSEEISKKELDTVLESANWAPNHKHTEPWRFKILQGDSKLKLGRFLVDKKAEIKGKSSNFESKKNISKFEKSHTVIAICIKTHPGKIPEWEEIAAVAMAVQNMWLTAFDLKIGAYWSSPKMIHHLDEFFEFETNERCLGFFYMGKFDGELPQGKRKTSIQDKIEYI
ncbi:nitroreductase family protein [Psychroflexus aestuariivivens]|uniref:nitroreductase family protein n=1 Tax=Psychroflexus aestuariivivens TaxID=1795040 RepID=UPI000FDBDA42|nr:nitroreductase [Psychroflexus aestuariivivens]